MAFDSVFAAAYIDNGDVHRVLGVKLRPFCIWHLFLLQVIESPFLVAGDVYLGHLRRAVGICRLKYPDSRTRLPFFPLLINQEKLEKHVEKFVNYIGDYLQKPDYSIIPPDEFTRGGRPSRKGPTPPPEVIQLVFDAAHGANTSVAEAWNMPIGQAYIAQAMYLKQDGLMVDFMDDKEREFQEALKEHLASQANGES